MYIWWHNNQCDNKKVFKICAWCLPRFSWVWFLPCLLLQRRLGDEWAGVSSSPADCPWAGLGCHDALLLKPMVTLGFRGPTQLIFFNRPPHLLNHCLFLWEYKTWLMTSSCLQFASWGFPPAQSLPLRSPTTSTPALTWNRREESFVCFCFFQKLWHYTALVY